MSATCSPDHPDAALLLPRSTYWQVVHILQASLPPVAADTPEARTHRDRAAIAEVASMLPANAEEASIAARCVAAHARAMEALRLANQHANDLAAILKLNAQSAAMMRQANAARSLLARLQAARQKRDANPATCDQAAWTEHCAIGFMANALDDASAPEPPPPAPVPVPDTETDAGLLTEAEQYAVIYPRRAVLIRSLGGLPDNCTFGPPAPEIVHAIVSGTSPILRKLDKLAEPVPA